jgi:transcriptional regulator with XRE-family HTH domain
MFAQKLIELRKKRNLTHDDLAKHLNITRQAYSYYESGKHEMNFDALCRVADYYNVTTDYLLDRANVTNAPFDAEELTLVQNYRMLDKRGKETIKNNMAFEILCITEKVKKSAM